ncbi:MAG TPA: V-type ATP synthase subunit F [Patescibacteria group bacterium]|nr:V-type ATP synthase subunit F [Patescibacteria group bacterium]
MPEAKEYPLAILGQEDIIVGFRALGFQTYAVKESGEFRDALRQAIAQKAAICLIEEELYKTCGTQLKEYQGLPLPVCVPFSRSARIELLDEMVKDIRLKATGTF